MLDAGFKALALIEKLKDISHDAGVETKVCDADL